MLSKVVSVPLNSLLLCKHTHNMQTHNTDRIAHAVRKGTMHAAKSKGRGQRKEPQAGSLESTHSTHLQLAQHIVKHLDLGELHGAEGTLPLQAQTNKQR
jgi:hypothetical protein